MSDFPAAHSMDTTWFAIDADGYVGEFTSFETGAVPTDARSLDYASFDLIADWCKASGGLLKIEIDYSKLDRLPLEIELLHRELNFRKNHAFKELKEKSDGYSIDSEYFYSVIEIENVTLLFSSIRSIDYLVQKGGQILCFVDDKNPYLDLEIRIYAYIVSNCYVEDIERMIESGEIIGEIAVDITDMYDELNFLNLINYQHDSKWENWIAGTYQKMDIIPNRPLKLADLPRSLQDKIGKTKFDNLRFAEIASIQPIEHLPCNTWGGWEHWIDTNGVERDRFPEYPNEE